MLSPTQLLRIIYKNGIFTVINVAGLALGMTAFLLITQYVTFEKSFNGFHTNLPYLYRLVNDKGQEGIDAYFAPGFAAMAANQIPGIKSVCRIAEGKNLGTGIISFSLDAKAGISSFREEQFAYADGNFFSLFSFKVLEGSQVSLSDPNVVALSKETSVKYFGQESAVGKVLTLNNQFGKTDYVVQLIYEKMPAFSDLHYDLIFSLSTLANPVNLNGNEMWASLEGTESQWLNAFVQLREGTDQANIGEQYTRLIHQVNPQDKSVTILQPLASMHLGTSLDDKLPVFSSLRFSYMMTGISIVILFIAWFNYVNLSTAGALKRAKEVGIRKVVGANRWQLIRQFMTEALILNTTSLMLSCVAVTVLQQPLESIIGQSLSFEIFVTNGFWIWAILLLITGTLASGAYASFILSGFNPSKALQGNFSRSARGIFVRKTLVVVQFTISISLMAATIVMFQQWKFMQNKDLGMNPSHLLVIRGAEVNKDDTFKSRSSEFDNKLSSKGFIERVSRSGHVPTEGFNFSTSGITRTNVDPDDKTKYDILTIDERYLDTYQIELIAGANFTEEMCSKAWNDMEYVILNEQAVQSLGFASPLEASGQKIQWGERQLEILGIIENYHHLSVAYEISPIVILPSRSGGYYTVKLTTGDMQDKLAALEKDFKQSFPGNPFEYQFLDQTFAAQYADQQKSSVIFTIASVLAIIIGCLGLLGLASYSVEQRTKEIGIRKVLGSDTFQLVKLLSKDFIVLVITSFVISIPLSWTFMSQWLKNFIYRVDISVAIYLLAGGVATTIAWLTVGTLAFRGARSNPVTSLRSE